MKPLVVRAGRAPKRRRTYRGRAWAQLLGASCACLLLPCAGSHARADSDRRPALHWVRFRGAEQCIDPRSLGRRVESITGPVIVAAANADVSIEAQIERVAEAAFVVRIRLSEGTRLARGERVASFKTSDCRALDNAIAFLIAMAIDPELGAEGALAGLDWLANDPALAAEELRSELAAAPARPLRELPASPPPADRPDVGRVPAAPAAAKFTPRWELSAAVGGGYGPAPSSSVGLALLVSRDLAPYLTLGLQLQAAAALERHAYDDVRSVTTRALGAALLACSRFFEPSELELMACAGPGAQLLIANGNGFSQDASAFLSSYGLWARVDVRHRFDAHWGLVGSALGQLDAAPPHVYFRRSAERVDVFEAKVLAFQIAFGISHAF